jgi:hypothetical protein
LAKLDFLGGSDWDFDSRVRKARGSLRLCPSVLPGCSVVTILGERWAFWILCRSRAEDIENGSVVGVSGLLIDVSVPLCVLRGVWSTPAVVELVMDDGVGWGAAIWALGRFSGVGRCF